MGENGNQLLGDLDMILPNSESMNFGSEIVGFSGALVGSSGLGCVHKRFCSQNGGPTRSFSKPPQTSFKENPVEMACRVHALKRRNPSQESTRFLVGTCDWTCSFGFGAQSALVGQHRQKKRGVCTVCGQVAANKLAS